MLLPAPGMLHEVGAEEKTVAPLLSWKLMRVPGPQEPTE
jgi:hypothetical protein